MSFVLCPFDTPWTRRTRASTPVLARVLHILCSMSLRHPMDAQDTSEHTGAHPCPVHPFFHVPSTSRGHAGHERAHRCSPVSCTSFFHVPSTPGRRTGHE